MMNKIVILCLTLLTSLGQATTGGGSSIGGGSAIGGTGGGGSPTYSVEEDWEGTGLGSWTSAGTLVDPDDTTAIYGSESLLMNGINARCTSPSFSHSHSESYFVINGTTFPAATTGLFALVGPGFGVDRLSSGALRVSGSVNGTPTTDTMPNSTVIHIKVRYTAGSGANAFYSVEWSTDGTFTDAASNKYSEVTTGTETANATNLRFLAESGATSTYRVDKVRETSGTMGNNPP